MKRLSLKTNNGNGYRSRGRPEHVPTKILRKRVANYSAVGYDQERIAARLGISRPTLRKHYAKELDFALMDMMGLARRGLAEALRAEKPWAICFVLKTRGKDMGWTTRDEHTGKDGAPIHFDLSLLDDNELDQVERITRKALKGAE